MQASSEALPDDSPASLCDGTVLLTGFGPFGHVLMNPSWEAVRTLVQETPQISVDDRLYSLRTPPSPVSVTYQAVDEAALAGGHYDADMKHQPCLIIHVGVGRPGAFNLETQASNEGYCMPDCQGALHCAGGVCVPGGAALLRTRLDVPRLVEAVASDGVSVGASTNAGRYLCEYIFYKSLDMAQQAGSDPSAAPDVLFVHVPPLLAPYPADVSVRTLRAIVQACLAQRHRRGSEPAAAAQAKDEEEGADADPFEAALFSLSNMGFSNEAAMRAALHAADGDLSTAAVALAEAAEADDLCGPPR